MSKPKKKIAEMLPVKKWLDLQEATAYTNTSVSTFLKDVAPHVTIACLGKKKVYRLAQIDNLIEENILITK